MIPALPEKDDTPPEKPRPQAEPAQPELSPSHRPRDAYEREVLDFVRNQLIAGATEEAVVTSLLPHDFSPDEARRLVRDLADDRGRSRFGRRKSRLFNDDDNVEDRVAQMFAQAQQEAAQRDMAHGAMWFLGGLMMTLLSLVVGSCFGGGIVFWGAMLWGAIQFLRGATASRTRR